MDAVDEGEIDSIKAAFEEADTDKNGFISRYELRAVLDHLGNWTDEEFDELFNQADPNGDGKLSYKEFVDFVMKEDDVESLILPEPAPKEAYDGPAPYMHQYWELIKTSIDDSMDVDVMMMELMETAFNPAKQEEMEKKEEALKKEAKSLLEKSFKHHDTKGNNVLDKEEAAVFFEHFVAEQADFAEAIGKLVSKRFNGVILKQMQESLKGEEWTLENYVSTLESKKDMKAAMAESRKAVEELITRWKENYKTNKVELNAEAFKVIDVNSDGTIQLDEFIAAMTTDDPKNEAFAVALGFEHPPPPSF